MDHLKKKLKYFITKYVHIRWDDQMLRKSYSLIPGTPPYPDPANDRLPADPVKEGGPPEPANEGGPPDPANDRRGDPANEPGGVGDMFCEGDTDGGSIISPLSMIASVRACCFCGFKTIGTRGPATEEGEKQIF